MSEAIAPTLKHAIDRDGFVIFETATHRLLQHANFCFQLLRGRRQ